MEVAFDDEGDDVNDKLMLVENSIDNDRNHGRKEVATKDLHDNYDEAASLKDGTTPSQQILQVGIGYRAERTSPLVQYCGGSVQRTVQCPSRSGSGR